MEIAEKIMAAKRQKITENLALPAEQGVYVIFKNGEAIYVGQATNLGRRLKQHLSSSARASTSAYRRALNRELGIELKDTREWTFRNCSIAFQEINDADTSKLVERLMITYYGRKGGKLLNN